MPLRMIFQRGGGQGGDLLLPQTDLVINFPSVGEKLCLHGEEVLEVCHVGGGEVAAQLFRHLP